MLYGLSVLHKNHVCVCIFCFCPSETQLIFYDSLNLSFLFVLKISCLRSCFYRVIAVGKYGISTGICFKFLFEQHGLAIFYKKNHDVFKIISK